MEPLLLDEAGIQPHEVNDVLFSSAVLCLPHRARLNALDRITAAAATSSATVCGAAAQRAASQRHLSPPTELVQPAVRSVLQTAARPAWHLYAVTIETTLPAHPVRPLLIAA